MNMDMHKDMEGCCDDEWSLEKVEDDQQVVAGKEVPAAKYHLLHDNPFKELISLLVSQEDEVDTKNTGPPDIVPPDLCILYHSLKIPAALQS